jgi:hypothetical protein
MDESWACSAAYVYVLHLDPGSRAWEYLRRNPRYVRDWMRYRRSSSQRIAVRWGLASLVDPRLDARQVSPVWAVGDLAPVTLVRDEMHHAQTDLDAVGQFSLWKLAGRKSLVEEGGETRLVLNSSVRAVQVRLGGHLGDGDRFAYQIPAAADEGAAWTALTGFRALIPVSGEGNASSPERPSRSDLFHVRALQVLDGLAAGGTHRELAVALFGVRAVAQGWQPDSALRAQLRYLIRRARALMEEGYRPLADNGPTVSHSGNTGGNRRKWVTDHV